MLAKLTAALLVIVLSIGAGAYIGFTVKSPPPVVIYKVGEPVVMRTEVGRLEVSTISVTEEFEQTTPNTILGISLGPTIAKIRATASYKYQVELAPEWRFIRRDSTFIVISPEAKPSLPVAIDTGTIQKNVSGTWSSFTGSGQINALEKSITRALEVRAKSPEYIELQREHARKTITEFVEKWVLSQDKWPKSKDYKIRVFFADEPVEKIQSSLLFPTPSVND
jgi:hypothetical protein